MTEQKLDDLVQQPTAEAERKPEKAGKKEYVYKQSYRQANIFSKFFYLYGNIVVNAVNRSKGELKYENLEDLKTDDEETDR